VEGCGVCCKKKIEEEEEMREGERRIAR